MSGGTPDANRVTGMVDGGVPGIAPDANRPTGMVGGVIAPDANRATRMVDGADAPAAAAGSAGAARVDHRVSAIPPAALRLQGRRAGLITRLLANTVDFGIAAAIVAGGYVAVAALLFLWHGRGFTFPDPGFGVLVIAGSVVMTVYLTACWITSGRTYGDHLLGLRVLGRRGLTLRPVTALLRAAFCVLFPIGLFWIVISRDNRSVQDVLLRSSVVYDWARTPLSGSR